LIFQHDESNNKPILDENGHLLPREDYRIDSVLCGDEDFAIACMKANLAYNKNLSRVFCKGGIHLGGILLFLLFQLRKVGFRG